MTLKLDQMLANLIAKEAAVSHFDCSIFVGKSGKMKEGVKAEIRKEFGESYLNDADYVAVFTGSSIAADKDSTKKLFKLVDRALGETANMLARADFDFIYNKPNGEDKPKGTVKYAFLKVTLN